MHTPTAVDVSHCVQQLAQHHCRVELGERELAIGDGFEQLATAARLKHLHSRTCAAAKQTVK
jgi:hypothetical protein